MENNECRCVCRDLPKLPADPVVAMAYVPMQTELVTYPSAEGFNNGTLFPELNKKFYGGKCCGQM